LTQVTGLHLDQVSLEQARQALAEHHAAAYIVCESGVRIAQNNRRYLSPDTQLLAISSVHTAARLISSALPTISGKSKSRTTPASLRWLFFPVYALLMLSKQPEADRRSQQGLPATLFRRVL